MHVTITTIKAMRLVPKSWVWFPMWQNFFLLFSFFFFNFLLHYWVNTLGKKFFFQSHLFSKIIHTRCWRYWGSHAICPTCRYMGASYSAESSGWVSYAFLRHHRCITFASEWVLDRLLGRTGCGSSSHYFFLCFCSLILSLKTSVKIFISGINSYSLR